MILPPSVFIKKILIILDKFLMIILAEHFDDTANVGIQVVIDVCCTHVCHTCSTLHQPQ